MKKFVISSVAVASFAFALVASAATAADMGSVTLRQGSRGAAVSALQSNLNNCAGQSLSTDGIFGSGTAAAVRAFQSSKGLTVDALVGNGTKSALSVACAGTTTNNNNNNNTNTSTTLSGGEADLDYTLVSESSITTDSKGQHAFTIEVEADRNGGDAKIERLDLVLSSSDTLYRAISAITLEVDGKEVSSVDTDSRSDWRGDRDTVRFSNLDIIVKSGQTVEIEVLLDLTDKATDDITLTKVEYRHTDGTGLVISKDQAGPVVATVDSIEDLGIKFSKNSKSPKGSALDLSSAVNNKVLVITDADVNKGIDGVLETATVEIHLTGAVNNSATAVRDLISRVAFNIDGKQVDTINGSSIAATSVTADKVTLTFDLDEFEVSEGDDFEFSVSANFRSIENSVISAVKVGSVVFNGYDEAKDQPMTAATAYNSHAEEFTITEGDIEVDINDSTVAVGLPLGNATTGTISFEITVENNTGEDLDIDNMTTDWDFDIKGYAGYSMTSITLENGNAIPTTLADGAEGTYKVTFSYTQKVTNQSFTIELKSIDGIKVGYVWAD